MRGSRLWIVACWLECLTSPRGWASEVTSNETVEAQRAPEEAPSEVVETWRRWTRIQALAQAVDGSLWLATNRGLERFDGEEFRGAAIDRCPTEWVAVTSAANDGVWAMCADGGLFRVGAQGVIEAARLGASDGRVVALVAQSERVWVATTTGLFALENGRWRRHATTNEPPAALAVGSDGALWVASTSGMIERRGRTSTRFTLGRPLAGFVAGFGRDALAVTTTGGLVRLSADGGTTALRTLRPSLPAGTWLSLATEQNDVVWWAVDGELWREGAARSIIGRVGSKPHLLVDRERSLWVASRNGMLSRVATPRYEARLDARDGRLAPAFSVAAAVGGDVYYTLRTGVVRVRRHEATVFSAPALPTFATRAVVPARKGGVWVGTLDAGVFRIDDGGTIEAWGRPAPKAAVQGLLEARDGALWVGTRSGGLAVARSPGVWRSVAGPGPTCESDAAECPGALVAFAEASDGSVVAASNGRGVWRLLDSEVQPDLQPIEANGDPPVRTSAVLPLDDELWVGTRGQGIVVRTRGAWRRLGEVHGLPSANVYGLASDAHGALWGSTDAGVFRVELAEARAMLARGDGRLRIATFGVADRMPSAQATYHFANPLVVDAVGDVWATTIAGVWRRRTAAPEPVLTPRLGAAVVDGRTWGSEEIVRLPFGSAEALLRIDVATYVAPHRVRLRWHSSASGAASETEARDIRVSGLRTGKTELTVDAFDDDSGRTAVASLHVTLVRAAWYQAPSIVLGGLAGLTLLAAVAYATRARLSRQRMALQLAERMRIARDLHDSLAQHFAGFAFQLRRIERLVRGQDTQKAAEALREAEQMLTFGRLESRRAIFRMRGTFSRDLKGRVEELVAAYRRSTDCEIVFSSEGAEAVAEGVVEDAARIVQEALANAVVHAGAKRIEVAIAPRTGSASVLITVADDGRGLEPAPAHDGLRFGRSGMEERARAMGGTLAVSQRNPSGTVVTLVLPAEQRQRGKSA